MNTNKPEVLTYQDRNKLQTPSYFIKRLKDNKIITLRVFQKYDAADPRKWTVLVDPGKMSVFITCFENKNNNKEIMFHLDDGGRYFPNNFYLKTHSMEIIVRALIEKGVTQGDTDSIFYKAYESHK